VSKSKVVCAIGSAVLAPVIYAVCIILLSALCYLLRFDLYHLLPHLLPRWVVLSVSAFGVICTFLCIKDVYRWLFSRCYRQKAAR
jgi:hypothetical protein